MILSLHYSKHSGSKIITSLQMTVTHISYREDGSNMFLRKIGDLLQYAAR